MYLHLKQAFLGAPPGQGQQSHFQSSIAGMWGRAVVGERCEVEQGWEARRNARMRLAPPLVGRRNALSRRWNASLRRFEKARRWAWLPLSAAFTTTRSTS